MTNSNRIIVALWSAALAVLVLPVLANLVGSVREEQGWSLEAYKYLVSHRRSFLLLSNTFLLGTCTTVLSSAVGVPLGLIIGRTNAIPWRLGIPLLVIPLLIPPYLHAVGWIHLVGPGGFVARAVSRDVTPLLEGSVYGLPGATAALGLGLFPIPALCVLAFILSSDPRLEDEAHLHVGPCRVLLHVTLAVALPGIVSGAVLVFLFAVVDFGVADQLLYRVYSTEVFTQFSAFYDQKRAFALALPPTVLCLAIVGRWRAWLHLRPRPQVGRFEVWSPPIRLSGRQLLLTRLLLAIPVLAVLSLIGALAGSTSPGAIATAIRSTGDELRQSLWISAVSALSCLALAVAGLCAGRGCPPEKGTGLAALLFVLPAPLLGICLVTFWNRPGVLGGLYGTDGMLVVGMVSRFLFVALLIMGVANRTVNRDILEQSLADGAGWLAAMLRVVLPLMLPGILAAVVACLALVLGEVGVSVLIVPPGGTTLAVRIMTLMHFGPEPVLAGTVLLLVASISVPAILAAWFLERLLRKRA